jgi:hypothetical protein
MAVNRGGLAINMGGRTGILQAPYVSALVEMKVPIDIYQYLQTADCGMKSG